MIPDSLTVLQLQAKRNQLVLDIERLLRQFVSETGVIVRIDPAHASPRFEDGTVKVDLAVYCGLSSGLEEIAPSVYEKSPPRGT